ncbi:MAG: cation diffusion facilitator family transporter [Tissierellia bacterium]|nr:cation diffusion facilitator family transporter [Tissierellia bacterium]
MLSILIKKFIGSDDFEDPSNRNKLISITGYLGLFFNILLFLIKISIGLIINSISVISDAINNLSDSISSIITIFGSYLAGKPADKNHPFGHGRGEYLASLIVGISIILVGASLFRTSIENIISPKDLNVSPVAILILIISISVKVYMYIYNMKVYKRVQSYLNKSQALDSRNDVIMSAVVILSVIVTSSFGIQLEGPIGLGVSIIIIKSGYDILKETGVILLGKKVDKDTINRLRKILMDGQYVIGVHDIEIHDYGKNKRFGTAHAEVPVNIDVYTMHEIIDTLEKQVKKDLYIDLSIHMDPIYCLDEDHFKPAPCRLDSKEKRDKVLEKNKKSNFSI